MRAIEAVLVLTVGLFVLGWRLCYPYRFPAGVIRGTSKKIFADHVINALPILGVVLALLGMATVHPVRAEWLKVPTDKQQINMQVPGMEHWNPGYSKSVDHAVEGTAYYTKWRLIDDYGIHAFLTYGTRARRFYYYTIKNMVHDSIKKDYAISFEGSEKNYDSKIGKFKYIYFSYNTESVKRECVGFGHLSSSRKIWISGRYCLSGDEPIDDAIVGPLIDSIDLGPGLN